MKKIFIVLVLLFLVGCDKSTQTETTLITTSQNTTQETTSEIQIDTIAAATISQVDDEIYIAHEGDALGYNLYVEDITPAEENPMFPINYMFELSSEGVFDLTNLAINRMYKIYVEALGANDSISNKSNNLYVKYFESLNLEEVNYNINNQDDLYISALIVEDVYYVLLENEQLSSSDYDFINGHIYIKKAFLDDYTDELVLELLTSEGKITVNIVFEDITKPYIISNNEVVYDGFDLEFVFDFCGGSLVDIDGSQISTSDYTLVNNILTIDADFIQGLFDAEPERNTVILGYQLRNDTDIVIGYLFIQRAATN